MYVAQHTIAPLYMTAVCCAMCPSAIVTNSWYLCGSYTNSTCMCHNTLLRLSSWLLSVVPHINTHQTLHYTSRTLCMYSTLCLSRTLDISVDFTLYVTNSLYVQHVVAVMFVAVIYAIVPLYVILSRTLYQTHFTSHGVAVIYTIVPLYVILSRTLYMTATTCDVKCVW